MNIDLEKAGINELHVLIPLNRVIVIEYVNI